ncbi:copper homeostasis membrane protein CopD [Sphingomonas sp. ERG5]|uniref:copper homeostasis membrane protein CopD n=1 Tax=Sphingomonas sp. ERG5 TaxID=1381597 RepID=UPI00054C1AAB|nr:copper homeostasis membrane protein CopD [Sphingomonas sp. ERG5]
MDDWPIIAVRFGLFADLGLLAGIPLFGLLSFRGADRDGPGLIPIRALTSALAILGIILSAFGFVLQAAAMAGTPVGELDAALFRMLLSETAMGWALIARLAALLAILGCGLAVKRRSASTLAPVSLLGAVAVATLAWSGHGVSTEGIAGWLHLGADILHMLAASAWLGALFVLLWLVMRSRTGTDVARIRLAHHALRGFSIIGTIIVATIVATGLVNGLFLVGLDRIPTLTTTLYGQLLIAKLALFGSMLGLAALNRYRLTPNLDAALETDAPQQALALLRYSLAAETSLALLILALIAWLGTLAPTISGS